MTSNNDANCADNGRAGIETIIELRLMVCENDRWDGADLCTYVLAIQQLRSLLIADWHSDRRTRAAIPVVRLAPSWLANGWAAPSLGDHYCRYSAIS